MGGFNNYGGNMIGGQTIVNYINGVKVTKQSVVKKGNSVTIPFKMDDLLEVDLPSFFMVIHRETSDEDCVSIDEALLPFIKDGLEKSSLKIDGDIFVGAFTIFLKTKKALQNLKVSGDSEFFSTHTSDSIEVEHKGSNIIEIEASKGIKNVNISINNSGNFKIQSPTIDNFSLRSLGTGFVDINSDVFDFQAQTNGVSEISLKQCFGTAKIKNLNHNNITIKGGVYKVDIANQTTGSIQLNGNVISGLVSNYGIGSVNLKSDNPTAIQCSNFGFGKVRVNLKDIQDSLKNQKKCM